MTVLTDGPVAAWVNQSNPPLLLLLLLSGSAVAPTAQSGLATTYILAHRDRDFTGYEVRVRRGDAAGK